MTLALLIPLVIKSFDRTIEIPDELPKDSSHEIENSHREVQISNTKSDDTGKPDDLAKKKGDDNSSFFIASAIIHFTNAVFNMFDFGNGSIGTISMPTPESDRFATWLKLSEFMTEMSMMKLKRGNHTERIIGMIKMVHAHYPDINSTKSDKLIQLIMSIPVRDEFERDLAYHAILAIIVRVQMLERNITDYGFACTLFMENYERLYDSIYRKIPLR